MFLLFTILFEHLRVKSQNTFFPLSGDQKFRKEA